MPEQLKMTNISNNTTYLLLHAAPMFNLKWYPNLN